MLLHTLSETLKSLIDLLGLPAFVVDVLPHGHFRYAAVNRALEQVCELQAAMIVDEPVGQVDVHLTGAEMDACMRRCVHTAAMVEYRAKHWLNVFTPLRDNDGEVVRILGIAVAERIGQPVQNETASEELGRLRRALTQMPLLLTQQDLALKYCWVGIAPADRAEQLLGRSDHEWLERNEEAVRLEAIKQRVLISGIGSRQEVTITDGGQVYHYDLIVEPSLDSAGRIIGVTCASYDITTRKRLEYILFREKERAEAALLSIADAVITSDADGLVESLNPAAEKLTGWLLSEAQGRRIGTVYRVFDEQQRQPMAEPMTRCLTGENDGTAYKILISRNGTEYTVQESLAPIRNRTGRLLGLVLVVSDLTEKRQLTRRVEYEAAHDPLTGLFNRGEFERRLQRVLNDPEPEQAEHVLCYMDLDRFKFVNDTCGHAAGDELLRQLVAILSMKIRKHDVLARLGGDEFGLLMEHCPLSQGLRVAESMRKAVESFRFHWDNKQFSIGLSIGVVQIDYRLHSMAEILKRADNACYRAKDAGRNRIETYRSDQIQPVPQTRPTEWLTRINQALEGNQLHLWWQRIEPLNKLQQYAGCELFLRMNDAQGRIVLPGSFLPAAERYHLAAKLDRWVVDAICRYLVRHPQLLDRVQRFHINLSAQSVDDPEFADFARAACESVSIPAHWFCFELPETAVVTNLTGATAFIQHLKNFGFSFALDDFGSGLSSFIQLKELAIDFLKIDATLVEGMQRDAVEQEVVQAIVGIAHTADWRVIAEGVEDVDTLRRLREIGVDYAQGYQIDRPSALQE